MWDVNSGRGCMYVGTGVIGGISLPSVQFYCENKTSLKNKVYQKKKKVAEEVGQKRASKTGHGTIPNRIT